MNNLEGLEELLSNLASLGGDIKETCKKGLERGAKKIQDNAKYLAPVKTGRLRNSIKTKSEITQDGAEAQVFTNCEYAVYVELGTGQRGKQANIERPEGVHYKSDWKGQSPQPFLMPAYLQAKNNGTVEQEVVNTIQREIRKMEHGSK